ncbi:NADPH-dependent glutamate synthase [Candidatus Dependentiae bacterium]|nr:NADPH-dependent glutamate synthase [Candidatus Dependentiae bacterium]
MIKKSKIEMPVQKPEIRVKNFGEVELGFTEEQALAEAARCLQCKKPKCVEGCPVKVQIPEFIKLICEKKYDAAAKKIKETNSLPAVCGRVCPQESQCEGECVLGKKGEAVSIGRLERFAADNEKTVFIPDITKNDINVAVIGSGPGGLTAASNLAQMGYSVTVFEALNKPGGVLTYGIPEFRLPKKIVEKECDYISKLGVKIKCNYVIGKIYTIDELFDSGFKAVFMANGAGLPKFLNIPGENLIGVYSANEFLTRVNLMKSYKFPEYDTPIGVGKNVVVFGGGNVAMDACRCAKRLGAENVYCVYRRSKNEMPARAEEVKHAEEEGIIFNYLTNPLKLTGDSEDRVKGVECIRMELGEPDSSGRRKPVEIPNSNFFMNIDTAIIAIGQSSNPIAVENQPDIKTNKWGYIIADETTGKTSKPGVFAGGDIVTGAATVILAMGAGLNAAKYMDEYIKTIK